MNKRMGVSLLGMVLMGGSTATYAADEPYYMEMRPYVSGMYSYVFDDDRRDIAPGDSNRAGSGAQLAGGLAINQWFGVELDAFEHRYKQNNKGDPSYSEWGGKLAGLFFYDRDPRFSPYFTLGGGAVRTTLNGAPGGGDPKATDPYGEAGLGFMKFFDVAGLDLGFRAELLYRRIFFSGDKVGQHGDDLGEGVLNVGFVIPIGSKPKFVEDQAAAPAACTDSDADGVCDSADVCPETPQGTPVDAKGCPVEKKAKAGDPNQKLEDVHFAFDQSELTEYSRGLLDGDAKTINGLAQKYPGLRVDVSGHTDWVGTDGYNQGLSERRANVVKQYLIRKGVDAGRISTYAYGEAKPIATNETEEGRALNRRAEIRTREK